MGEKCLTGLKRQFPNEMNHAEIYLPILFVRLRWIDPFLAPEGSGGFGNTGRDGRYVIPADYECDP